MTAKANVNGENLAYNEQEEQWVVDDTPKDSNNTSDILSDSKGISKPCSCSKCHKEKEKKKKRLEQALENHKKLFTKDYEKKVVDNIEENKEIKE